eukprot:gene16958-biopygen9799
MTSGSSAASRRAVARELPRETRHGELLRAPLAEVPRSSAEHFQKSSAAELPCGAPPRRLLTSGSSAVEQLHTSSAVELRCGAPQWSICKRAPQRSSAETAARARTGYAHMDVDLIWEMRNLLASSRPEAGPDSRLGVHVVRVAFGIPEVISTSGPRRGGMQAPCPPAREPCQSVINNYVSCAYIDFHVIAHRCIDAQPQSAQQRGAADGTGFDPLKQGHMNMFSQTGPKKHSPVSVIFPEILRSGPSGGSFERTLVTGSGTSQNRSGEACSHDGTGALSRHPRRLPAKAWMRDASKPFPILV